MVQKRVKICFCLPPLDDASDDECDDPEPDDDDWFVELFDKFNEATSLLLAFGAWFVACLATCLLLRFDVADAFDDADDADEDASDELDDDDDPSESLNIFTKRSNDEIKWWTISRK